MKKLRVSSWKFLVSSFRLRKFKRTALNFLTALTLLTITACGFHPVYGVNKHTQTGVEDNLGQVSIGNIRDREGQYLRNALIDRFYRDGYPKSPRYILDVAPIREGFINLDITKSSDATRGQLRMDTKFTLKDYKSGETLMERGVRSITSYNILASEFATRVSEDNTRLNALEDLAAQIEQQLALYFKRNP